MPNREVVIQNCTPHPLTLYSSMGVDVIAPSGQLARVKGLQRYLGDVGPLPVFRSDFDEVTGLPAPQPGTIYVVSTLILQALKQRGEYRPDVVAPGTGPLDSPIRDSRNQITGITRFVTLADQLDG